MADAQLSGDQVVRAVLLEQNDEFRQLVSQHHHLDEQIRRLTGSTHLSEQQQIEETALKKRKLALKDRIEQMVRQQHRADPVALRTQ
jgi:uncharacterized protein YdcH (DUF465 family)